MAVPPPRRKPIRLGAAEYADPTAVCSITIASAARYGVFENSSLAVDCREALVRRATSSGVVLYAYCFMPDHLHLLLSPAAGKSLIDFVQDFKGETTHIAWRHGH